MSYAHADFAAGHGQWIRDFRNLLETFLSQELGVKGELEVFLDSKIAGGEMTVSQLLDAPRHAAIFLAFGSNLYVGPGSRCLDELRSFLTQPSTVGRLFVPQVHSIAEGRYQDPALQDAIHVDFCDASDILLKTHEEAFERQMMRLAKAIAKKLRELKVRPVLSQGAQQLAANARKAILIGKPAESADQEIGRALKLKRFLSQYPETCSVQSADDFDDSSFETLFEGALRSTTLFVQLLSTDYEALTMRQAELARKAGCGILQWRHPSTDPAAATDPNYRAFLEDASVEVLDFEELKRRVLAWAPPADPETTLSGMRVLISAAIEDKAIAFRFLHHFQERNIDADILVRHNTEIAENLIQDSRTLLYIHGAPGDGWLSGQLYRLRKRPGPEPGSKDVVICVGPPSKDEISVHASRGVQLPDGNVLMLPVQRVRHVTVEDWNDETRLRQILAECFAG